MHVIWHQHHEMCVANSLRISMFDRFENGLREGAMCELILSALFAANRNKIVCFAGIDLKRDIMRQSLMCWQLHCGRDAALRRTDSAARCPCQFHNCLSNIFQRAEASSRAFLSPSRTLGLFGSPERMKPWPAPL